MTLLAHLNNFFRRIRNFFTASPDVIYDTCYLSSKYLVVKNSIGKGTYGCVSLVKDIKTNKLYACKKFKKKPNYTNDFFIRKLHNEHSIASNLNHKNVISFYELVNHENRWYSIIEYCEHGDLLHNFHRSALNIKNVEHIFKQLVCGIAYLHSNGIAHRDLKLENLLLTRDRVLKISDFGTADMFKLAFEPNKRLSTGFHGSPPYLAPEIYGSELYDAEKTDVWSCGVILFTLLFGYFPFKEATESCKSYQHFLKRKDDKNYLIDRLPGEIKELLLKMMESDPGKRMTIFEVMESEWVKGIDI